VVDRKKDYSFIVQDDTMALVRRHKQDSSIAVNVRGCNVSNMMRELVANIDHFLATFPRSKFTVCIPCTHCIEKVYCFLFSPTSPFNLSLYIFHLRIWLQRCSPFTCALGIFPFCYFFHPFVLTTSLEHLLVDERLFIVRQRFYTYLLLTNDIKLTNFGTY